MTEELRTLACVMAGALAALWFGTAALHFGSFHAADWYALPTVITVFAVSVGIWYIVSEYLLRITK